ncbi:MAG: DUF1203 domain-containing protein, partial [Hyphococcus sp.]
MTFIISGLDPAEFEPLFDLDDETLQRCGVFAKTGHAKPGYPCRITLEDAEIDERVLLLNHESHRAPTPFRSSYAIYVRQN